ncbi:hypothetical protein [Bacillus atrophaeus]|uniref:hypothetical protein n=1 Tax=Bacillus atrophaeus TaxID=1452 RepID=UPI001238A533|nr:hypothetical protein [Bacillus atrophaeus]KAA6448879.1 hypothetical protein DX926_12685 [Bacillus atrophaeus]
MKTDQISFDKAKKIAEHVEQLKNDQDIIDYLCKHDSVTLDQLKQYYSTPYLPLQFLVKIAVSCMFIAMALASFFFIQVKTFFAVPISDVLPFAFTIFTVLIIILTYLKIIRGKNRKNTTHFLQQTRSYKRKNLINAILLKKYTNQQQTMEFESNYTHKEDTHQNLDAVAKQALTYCKNDKDLFNFLYSQDDEVLSNLRTYFSPQPLTVSEYIKWMFIGSIIVIYATTLFSGQISYIDISYFFYVLLFFIFLKNLINVVRLLNIVRKGQLHSVLHFAKSAEYLRITGIIDFISNEKYNTLIK